MAWQATSSIASLVLRVRMEKFLDIEYVLEQPRYEITHDGIGDSVTSIAEMTYGMNSKLQAILMKNVDTTCTKSQCDSVPIGINQH